MRNSTGLPTVTAMGAFGRGAVIAVAVIAAMGTLAGCSLSFDSGREYEDERTETGTVREVRLDGGDGGVTVVRGDGTAVRIHRTVWYRGTDPDVRADRLDGTTLVLDTRCGPDCSISYRVTVPTLVNVTGMLDTGPVDLSDIGAVAIDTQDGGVAVRRASGDVSVRTDTGPISLDTVAGTVTARTHDGGISGALRRPGRHRRDGHRPHRRDRRLRHRHRPQP